MIPGLEKASFMRMGSVHRNTFVDAPRVLDDRLQLRALPGVYLAGQLTGVEGYVESTACGFLCGVFLASKLMGKEISSPPKTTALGGLMTHLANPAPSFQPSNITWAHIASLEGPAKKAERKERLAERALADLERYRVELLAE
jgi:methylenetetrahydrofolate--tRNA-(uracil-5-)-methyltransferase